MPFFIISCRSQLGHIIKLSPAIITGNNSITITLGTLPKKRRMFLLLILWLETLYPIVLWAKDLMSGIVRIESSQDGTGFLINRKENTIDIIIANHVVEKDDNPKIYFSQDKNLKGTLHHIARKVHSQLENDLALLRIVTEESQKNFFDQLFIFTIADSSSSLKENSMVSTIGIPEYKTEKILDNECKIVSADKNEILFSSDFVAPDYSGGPLIGDDQQVLGMIREGLNANIHKAIPAEVINNFLKEALKKEEAQKEKALCKEAINEEAINNVQNLLQRHTQSISSHKFTYKRSRMNLFVE